MKQSDCEDNYYSKTIHYKNILKPQNWLSYIFVGVYYLVAQSRSSTPASAAPPPGAPPRPGRSATSSSYPPTAFSSGCNMVPNHFPLDRNIHSSFLPRCISKFHPNSFCTRHRTAYTTDHARPSCVRNSRRLAEERPFLFCGIVRRRA